MELKQLILERVAADKAKRRLQKAQRAAFQAMRGEATQDQENQAMVDRQIRTESSQPPVKYADLKASKRKAVDTIDDDTSAGNEFLVSNVIIPSMKKAKISPAPKVKIVQQQAEKPLREKKGNEYAPARKAPRSKVKPNYTQQQVLINTSEHPEWYDKVGNEKFSRGHLQEISHTRTMIKNCLGAYNRGDETTLKNRLSELARKIHEMEFYPFLSAILIKNSKILESGGLFHIFDEENAEAFPHYLRADAEALYTRWLQLDFEPSLLRGIRTVKGTLESGKTRLANSLDKGYKFKKPANVAGDNGLVNGQWFPNRACAFRDGAHGELEAGIHGKAGEGAFSVVVAQGGYADKDEGETIGYCGTQSQTSTPTRHTLLLQEAFMKGQKIRVLRAAKSHSKYAPKQGIRFDGMYEIVSKEVLKSDTAMFRFTLQRVAGQGPIRYEGEEARPTAQELDQLKKIKSLLV